MTISQSDSLQNSKIFLDTNTLIYLKFASLGFHKNTKSIFLNLAEHNNTFYISNQVLREYISSCTREKFHRFYEEVLFDCEELKQTFKVLEDIEKVSISLLNLCKNYKVSGKQVHDANIVATMESFSIPYILTANVNDFTRFGDLINIIPIFEDTQ